MKNTYLRKLTSDRLGVDMPSVIARALKFSRCKFNLRNLAEMESPIAEWEEIQLLSAMYTDEFVILEDGKGISTSKVRVLLTPNTAMEDSSAFLKCTLTITLPREVNVPDSHEQYPAALPEMVVSEERGMDESQVRDLVFKLREKSSELSGSAMLFQIIELARDTLVLWACGDVSDG